MKNQTPLDQAWMQVRLHEATINAQQNELKDLRKARHELINVAQQFLDEHACIGIENCQTRLDLLALIPEERVR